LPQLLNASAHLRFASSLQDDQTTIAMSIAVSMHKVRLPPPPLFALRLTLSMHKAGKDFATDFKLPYNGFGPYIIGGGIINLLATYAGSLLAASGLALYGLLLMFVGSIGIMLTAYFYSKRIEENTCKMQTIAAQGGSTGTDSTDTAADPASADDDGEEVLTDIHSYSSTMRTF
jgi:hypothetical protein